MSEQTTTICDGCGEVIDTDRPHLTIHQYGLTVPPGHRRLPDNWNSRSDLHGVACIPLWLERMPLEVRLQLTDRAFIR